MLSKTMLTIFYGGAYAWFCIGLLLIAIPAIKELFSMFAKKNK